MASLDAVNTYDLDLSVERDRFELYISASNIWITLVDPSKQDAGSIILDLSSYYNDNSPINATVGFNIRCFKTFDRIYISHPAQPGKRLRLNYSNTIIYRPYQVSSSSPTPIPTPTIPTTVNILDALVNIPPNHRPPAKIFNGNPKRIYISIFSAATYFYYISNSDSNLIMFFNGYEQSTLYPIYDSDGSLYKGDIYMQIVSVYPMDKNIIKGFELCTI